MPSRQVKDILDHVRAYHRTLSKRLADLSSRESDDRLVLLLKYMSRHEHHFEKTLAAYEKDAAENLLDTWLKFVPDETIDAALKHLQLTDEMKVNDIIAAVLVFDKSLIELYRELANEAPIQRIQELFTDLIQMEENKDRRYSLSALEIFDQ